MNHKKYYIELGKLFYAIANADGKIEPKEIAALREIIQNQFVTVEAESDEFGVNDAYYAEFEFETLNEKSANVELAFNSFINFVKLNRNEIDKEMKQSCIMAATAIADSFHKKNQSEVHYISRLKHELHKI